MGMVMICLPFDSLACAVHMIAQLSDSVAPLVK